MTQLPALSKVRDLGGDESQKLSHQLWLARASQTRSGNRWETWMGKGEALGDARNHEGRALASGTWASHNRTGLSGSFSITRTPGCVDAVKCNSTAVTNCEKTMKP